MNPRDVHEITRGQIEHILKCLRYIDRARDQLKAKGPGNEGIVSELLQCANGINDVVKDLPRVREGD